MKNEWQSIDSAPKDGTQIDVWAEMREYNVVRDNKRITNVFWSTSQERWLGGMGLWVPTHWMSIPEAPIPTPAPAKPKGNRGLASASMETRLRVGRIGAPFGGRAISANREHMRAIGTKGGINNAKNREHMAEIGRKGGIAAAQKYSRNKETTPS